MMHRQTVGHFSDLSYWGNELQSVVTKQGGYAEEIVRSCDLSTCDGVKALAEDVIDLLTNNLVPTVYDAGILWQCSQCLKKFRYGGSPSPEAMMQGWVDRNRTAETIDPPSWVIQGMKQLLAPLNEAWLSQEANGRFGNGAVYEGLTSIARWNVLHSFPYNVRDPDDIGDWTDSSCLSSRLCCVPKDMFKLRSITVEPAEATFLQQYYRQHLLMAAQVLPKSSGIPSQLYGGGPELQRRRCLKGSLIGHLATIDLSDASDSVPWHVVQQVFPPAIVAALERARSPYVEVNGVRHRCHMFAGMGNATTFVVESMYFWALVTVLARSLRDFVPVSVFGDDIILATRTARNPWFQDMVASCGLILNRAKSGLSPCPGFRESCGVAAYLGDELPLLRVQGYRIDKPEELCSLCTLISTCLAPDSRYAPFCKEWMVGVGKALRQVIPVPLLPYPLIREGAWICDPGEQIGEWSYRARWDADSQHPVVKARVPRVAVKRIRLRDLTNGEALGILNGQIHTEFNDAPAGFSSRCSTIRLPLRGVSWQSAWIPCWVSGRNDFFFDEDFA
jgi:hypothetical protein